MPLPPRWRYKLDRWRSQIAAKMNTPKEQPRPRMCPACGTLVGATASRCHQCGTSLSFSFAAASRSMSKYLPQTSPVTYGILSICLILYGVSLLSTMRLSGFEAPSGGLLGGLFNLGGINVEILERMGASLPWGYNLAQPWRFVTAIFLHGGLLHVGFNMWILMDLGPTLEDIYGSPRFFFIFIVTGIFGYIFSSFTGHVSVGASGSLLGLIGMIMGLTKGQRSMGMQMLRQQAVYLLIYVVVIGFMPGLQVDNFAHAGGFAAGFVLGKLMADRQPSGLSERRRATAMGWTTGLVVAASFAFMLFYYFQTNLGGG